MTEVQLVIIKITDHTFTDELNVEFHQCDCGCEYVPRITAHGIEMELSPLDITARFCPRCGRKISWVA